MRGGVSGDGVWIKSCDITFATAVALRAACSRHTPYLYRYDAEVYEESRPDASVAVAAGEVT